MAWEDRSDRIEHESPVYVWQQLADDLRSEMESGELAAGSRLPSGPEVAEIYGVSRVTAAKAMNHLRELEWVVIVNGKGTFVRRS